MSLPQFAPAVNLGTVKADVLREKSYAQHSSFDPGICLIGNDGGNASGLYLVEIATGKLAGTFLLPYENKDTEASFRGPVRSGRPSIGLVVNKSHSIILVDEPKPGQTDYKPNLQSWVTSGWPNKGCEAAARDPLSGDVYLFEKYADSVGDKTRALVRIPSSEFNRQGTVAGSTVAQLTFPSPVDSDPRPSDADISRKGDLILVCMQAGMSVYERTSGQTVADALKTTPRFLPPVGDGCGEAACWRYDAAGNVISVLNVGERTFKVMQERRVMGPPQPQTVDRDITLKFKGLPVGKSWTVSGLASSGELKSTASGSIKT